MKGSRGLVIALIAAAGALAANPAWPQAPGSYPARPVKIVVTLTPGGSSDVVARLYAQKLSEEFKQPVVVENRTGGNSIPGADYVAKSAPDGYTLLLGNSSLLAIQPGLYSKLPYDPQRDFAPICLLVYTPTVLVVHPSVAARSVVELAKLAGANPGKLNYASPGSGSPFHLSAELFKTRTGTNIVHVPYKGNAPAMLDLLAGRVQLMFANVSEVLPSIQAGKVKALASTTAKRASLLPEVPTMAEAGFENAESSGWFALVAPKDTPREVVAKLNAELVRETGQPAVRQRLYELGVEPAGYPVEESESAVRAEYQKWGKVIRDAGIRLEQ